MERVRIDPLAVYLKSAFRSLKSAILLGALLLALCSPATAQQAKKVYQIGYLSSRDPATESARAEGIRLALCASLATSKDRTLPSSTDMGGRRPVGLKRMRWNWCV